MVTNTKLVGITGRARAGKDTVADMLGEKVEMHCKSPMAGPLKKGIRAIFNTFPEDEEKEKPVPGFDFTWRRAMQTLGTEWGRDLDEDIWVKLQQQKLDSLTGVVDLFIVPDIRFDNEAEWLLANKGFLIEVVRDSAGPVEAHKSEGGVSYAPDAVVYNNGDFDDLDKAVREIVWKHFQ